jgi:hypothetical protein
MEIKSTTMSGAGHVAYRGEKRNACRILLGKSEEGDRSESQYLRWNMSIRLDLKEAGYDNVD